MTPSDEIKILFTDADGLADNEEDAIVILSIRRRDVETRSLASALERLHVLTDSRENVLRYRECVVFQVEGYDDDPRELSEIPEVRAYFRQLTDEWPHWIWFLHRRLGAIPLLFALLCKITVLRGPDTERQTAFESTEEMRDVMLELLQRGIPLFDTYEIPSQEIDAAVASAFIDLGLQADAR